MKESRAIKYNCTSNSVPFFFLDEETAEELYQNISITDVWIGFIRHPNKLGFVDILNRKRTECIGGTCQFTKSDDYLKWAPGEPSSQEGEDCVKYSKLLLYDSRCDAKNGLLCVKRHCEKELFASCSDSNECESGLCGENKLCTCKQFQFINDNNKCEDGLFLKRSCLKSIQCSARINYSECNVISRKCACIKTHREVGNECSEKLELGGSCTSNEDCLDGNCNIQAATCICKSGFYQVNKTCEKKLALFTPCNRSAECLTDFCNITCQCGEGFYLNGNICLYASHLNDICINDANCLPNDKLSECDEKLKRCRYLKDNTIIQGPGRDLKISWNEKRTMTPEQGRVCFKSLWIKDENKIEAILYFYEVEHDISSEIVSIIVEEFSITIQNFQEIITIERNNIYMVPYEGCSDKLKSTENPQDPLILILIAVFSLILCGICIGVVYRKIKEFNPKKYARWKQKEMRNPIIPHEDELKNILIKLNLMKESDKKSYIVMQKMYLTYFYNEFYDFNYDYIYDKNYPYDTLAEVSAPHLYQMDFEDLDIELYAYYSYDPNNYNKQYDYDSNYENKNA
ncbi:unnamed protein product [Gordionus sp. m RMFG-2023]